MAYLACAMLGKMGVPVTITAKFITSENTHGFMEVYFRMPVGVL
jgi:hypothetical protein